MNYWVGTGSIFRLTQLSNSIGIAVLSDKTILRQCQYLGRARIVRLMIITTIFFAFNRREQYTDREKWKYEDTES